MRVTDQQLIDQTTHERAIRKRGTDETDHVRLAVSTVEDLVHAAAKEFDNLLCPDEDRR